MNAFNPIKPIQCVFKIREVAEASWWVYRYEMGQNGTLKTASRVVFFGKTLAAAEQWIDTVRQESSVYLLSEN